ncbi:MAG: hypothetical protein AAB783_02585 [Patescibacteria group bacterium]
MIRRSLLIWCSVFFAFASTAHALTPEEQVASEIVQTQVGSLADVLVGLKAPFVCLSRDGGSDPSDEFLQQLEPMLFSVRKISECISPAIELWISGITVNGDEATATGGLTSNGLPVIIDFYKITKSEGRWSHFLIQRHRLMSQEHEEPKRQDISCRFSFASIIVGGVHGIEP